MRTARLGNRQEPRSAQYCSTSRQAGTAYSGGKPPHSTVAVLQRKRYPNGDFVGVRGVTMGREWGCLPGP
jgi:hypothetical protein